MYRDIVHDKGGNRYFYFPSINILLPADLVENNKPFYDRFENFLNSRSIPVFKRGDRARIIKELANVRNCLLEVTESCNLRCRYCIHSGHFPDRRVHSYLSMRWDTAIECFNFFIDWILRNQKYQINPYSFSFCYYGGEPLLNIDLISSLVDYSEAWIDKHRTRWPFNFRYEMTTNGLLLNEKIVSFLVEKDFRILISIDGPEPIHEKNKGKGTFQILEENIKSIWRKYPEYYSSNVSFSIVYAKDTDLLEIKKYFSSELFEACYHLSFGPVITNFSDLHFPENGINEELAYSEIETSLKEGRSLKKIEKVILKEYFPFFINSLTQLHRNSYAGFCTLGSRSLQFSTKGTIYGCEKAGKSFSIGDIRKGLDIEKIARIAEDVFNKTENCENCIAQANCVACVASTGFMNELTFNEYCRTLRSRLERIFPGYIEFRKLEKKQR